MINLRIVALACSRTTKTLICWIGYFLVVSDWQTMNLLRKKISVQISRVLSSRSSSLHCCSCLFLLHICLVCCLASLMEGVISKGWARGEGGIVGDLLQIVLHWQVQVVIGAAHGRVTMRLFSVERLFLEIVLKWECLVWMIVFAHRHVHPLQLDGVLRSNLVGRGISSNWRVVTDVTILLKLILAAWVYNFGLFSLQILHLWLQILLT